MPKTQIIILAGGKGTRINANGLKVLIPVGGQPILLRLLRAVKPLCPKPIIVVGYQGEKVIAATKNQYHYVWQREQLGTGHAVACAREYLENKAIKNIIVLPGDHPLVSEETLAELVKLHEEAEATLTLTTGLVDDFAGDFALFYNFGRIIRGVGGDVRKIVELKDADEKEKAVSEVNLGYYCFSPPWLWQNIGKLKDNNQAGEYYLTDLIQAAVKQGKKIGVLKIKNIVEGYGINTSEQLAAVEKYLVPLL